MKKAQNSPKARTPTTKKGVQNGAASLAQLDVAEVQKDQEDEERMPRRNRSNDGTTKAPATPNETPNSKGAESKTTVQTKSQKSPKSRGEDTKMSSTKVQSKPLKRAEATKENECVDASESASPRKDALLNRFGGRVPKMGRPSEGGSENSRKRRIISNDRIENGKRIKRDG